MSLTKDAIRWLLPAIGIKPKKYSGKTPKRIHNKLNALARSHQREARLVKIRTVTSYNKYKTPMQQSKRVLSGLALIAWKIKGKHSIKN